MQNTDKIHTELLLSDARGVYIPRDFAQMLDLDKIPQKFHVDLKFLAQSGPNTDGYWDTWQELLDNFKMTTQEYPNEEWTIYQDGDLWLIRADRDASPEDWDEFWGEVW